MSNIEHPTEQPVDLSHRLRRMTGRDPNEPNRVATPLELLFDLSFAVAFGIASSQASHLVAQGFFADALAGYTFAVFAICWAWFNYAWFATGFDTDDWFYRICTMLQIIGVVVMALGLRPFFEGIHQGEINNLLMVTGYVVMRIAMAIQWLRAYLQAPAYRKQALTYLLSIVIAQAGWTVVAFLHQPPRVFVFSWLALLAVELSGPIVAERQDGGTPWHPHHLAERFSLLAIITLGEGLVGTITAVGMAVEGAWSRDDILLVVAGVGLTLALWWMYFAIDQGTALHARRSRVFGWAYLHIVIFGAIAATGAGLHVAGYYLEHRFDRLTQTVAVASVAAPVLLFVVLIYVIYMVLYDTADWPHLLAVGITAAILLTAILMAHAGVDMGLCLVVVMLAPFVIVAIFELYGHRQQADAIQRLPAAH